MMKRHAPVLFLMVLAFSKVWAQSSQSAPAEEVKALKQEIEALKARQARLEQELQELKNTLAARGIVVAPTDVVVDVRDNTFKGDPRARLAVIEFSDYQCPFCGRHVREVLPALERDYIAAGKIRYYFLDFPLESIHPQAFKAAEAANCAAEQGRFWEMHARLFANQGALMPDQFISHAQALSLDVARFTACLESGKYAEKIRHDLRKGQGIGVSGTPMFLVGYVEADGTRVKGVRWIRGAQPFAAFREALDALLASSK